VLGWWTRWFLAMDGKLSQKAVVGQKNERRACSYDTLYNYLSSLHCTEYGKGGPGSFSTSPDG
jgi:hypothetical protein